MIGWEIYRVAGFTSWCGHGQEFVPWPDKDGYWTLVPVVEAVANRLRADETSEDCRE